MELPEPHRAITLFQPFASAVVAGIKDFETRSWGTKYRGRLYIHSSARFDEKLVREYMRKEWFVSMISGLAAEPLELARAGNDEFVKFCKTLHRSAILGYVDLVNTCKATEFMDRYHNVAAYALADTVGDLSLTSIKPRHAWELKRPLRFDESDIIKDVKGHLSIWKVGGNESYKLSEYPYNLMDRVFNPKP